MLALVCVLHVNRLSSLLIYLTDLSSRYLPIVFDIHFSNYKVNRLTNYFKNCEVPIICYKYNKPIRGAIFNFNQLVSDLDIETCTPDS